MAPKKPDMHKARAKLPDGSWYHWNVPETPRWAKKDPELWALEKQERSKAAQAASREKAWRGRTEVKLKQKKTLEDAFGVFDADGSGKLDKAEMKEILTRANSSGGEMTDADAEEFISLFDKDGDGKIDIKECEPLPACEGAPTHPRLPLLRGDHRSSCPRCHRGDMTALGRLTHLLTRSLW